MILFVMSLLFSGLLMTHGDRIIDDLSVPPLADPVYVFDVRTDAPVSDVKAALSGVILRHSFKVIGERRYLFVAISNSTQALRDLDFPEGSVVTQYPAGHLSDFLRMFGASSGWEEDYDTESFNEDTVFTFADWTMSFSDNVSAKNYRAILGRYGRRFAKVHAMMKPLLYSVVGSYPPRVLCFLKTEDNSLQVHVAKHMVPAFGGPANFGGEVMHIVTI